MTAGHRDNGHGWCTGCPTESDGPGERCTVRSDECPVQKGTGGAYAARVWRAMSDAQHAWKRYDDAQRYAEVRRTRVEEAEQRLRAVEEDAPVKAQRVEVTPDVDGVASVVHGMGLEKVTAHASRNGEFRPIVATNVISPDEVEVITTPDATTVLVVGMED